MHFCLEVYFCNSLFRFLPSFYPKSHLHFLLFCLQLKNKQKLLLLLLLPRKITLIWYNFLYQYTTLLNLEKKELFFDMIYEFLLLFFIAAAAKAAVSVTFYLWFCWRLVLVVEEKKKRLSGIKKP